jgi:hypothetical protein
MADFDPEDPVFTHLLRRISAELIGNSPDHFEEIQCEIREGVEDGHQALYYSIDCPQFPDQVTTEASDELNDAAFDLVDYCEQRMGGFPGFRFTCRLREDGEWDCDADVLTPIAQA